MSNEAGKKNYRVSISPDHLVDSDLLALPTAIWEGKIEQIEDITLPEATLSGSVVVGRDDFATDSSIYRRLVLSRFLILGCDGSFQVEHSW